ncbi:hypothetical protein HYT56_04255 [Candidatus Woesearchaeota archaeon]|nr:hypothetical protein [Candidatus Woesearchaeota archaeon]
MRTEEINQRLDALTDFTISAMERIGKMSVKKEESMKKSSIKTGRK